MATGACGINCDVCGLKVKGICSGCQAGTEFAAEAVAKHRCPVLRCAVGKGVAYCLRDCPSFPCNTMEQADCPFSAGYLGMHRYRMGIGVAWMH